MPVELCTVWAPRPESEQWRKDYVKMMELQRASALRFGHTHTVITDDSTLTGFDILAVDLPQEVMPAMIMGVIERLMRPVFNHIIFADVDVLVNRPLHTIFDGKFDLGLTRRINEKAPINNGVMYMDVNGAVKARKFFEQALAICGTHWGGDQEAISQAAAPVPEIECILERESGIWINFMSMKDYAAVPKQRGMRHEKAYCIHFKGNTKQWMHEYYERFLNKGM